VSDVLVHLPGEVAPRRYENAYLQADDATVLIRQQVDGCWTTTAVYAPGTYKMAMYDDATPEAQASMSSPSTSSPAATGNGS
jgi:hypothetical protein